MYNTKGEKYFIADGIRFCRDDKTGYYLCSTRNLRLHRYVWVKYKGEIPKGFHVHHIDHNKNNNNIENLCIMSMSEHEKLHGIELTEEQRQARRDNLTLNARPKANEWHGSEEGIKWHIQHGIEVAKGLKSIKVKKICAFCGETFYDNGFNKAVFCSNKCKSANRRKIGVDNIQKTCPICRKVFTTSKYSKQQTCSKTCSWKLRSQKGKSKMD